MGAVRPDRTARGCQTRELAPLVFGVANTVIAAMYSRLRRLAVAFVGIDPLAAAGRVDPGPFRDALLIPSARGVGAQANLEASRATG
jgi:hypothetical protein